MSIEQGKDISELFRRVNNLIRIGKVVSVNYTTARAKVKIGKLVTDFLPWMTPSTSVWVPLKIGEQVVVLSPNGDLRMGMILPALYQNSKSAPSRNTTTITISTDIDQRGSLIATGNIKATGEVEAKGKKLSAHTHQFSYNAGETPTTATTNKPS